MLTLSIYQTSIDLLTKSTTTEKNIRAEIVIITDTLNLLNGTSGDRTHDRQLKRLLIYR
jgi:hypothetical protein